MYFSFFVFVCCRIWRNKRIKNNNNNNKSSQSNLPHRYGNSRAIYRITQCYRPPSRGDIPAFTQAEAGTRSSDPGGMQGWVDLVGIEVLTGPDVGQLRSCDELFGARPATPPPMFQWRWRPWTNSANHYATPRPPNWFATWLRHAGICESRYELRQTACCTNVRAVSVLWAEWRNCTVQRGAENWTHRRRPLWACGRIRIQTAGLAFGGTGLCSCRVRGVDGSCVKHLTAESYMVIYAPNSYTY